MQAVPDCSIVLSYPNQVDKGVIKTAAFHGSRTCAVTGRRFDHILHEKCSFGLPCSVVKIKALTGEVFYADGERAKECGSLVVPGHFQMHNEERLRSCEYMVHFVYQGAMSNGYSLVHHFCQAKKQTFYTLNAQLAMQPNGDRYLARRFLLVAFMENPNNKPVVEALAKMALESGDDDMARAMYEKMHSFEPHNLSVAYQLAKLILRTLKSRCEEEKMADRDAVGNIILLLQDHQEFREQMLELHMEDELTSGQNGSALCWANKILAQYPNNEAALACVNAYSPKVVSQGWTCVML